MRPATLDGHYGRSVTVDHCAVCRLLWFDHMETVAMSRQGLLTLFRLIRETEGAAGGPLESRLCCPRCKGPLARIHNMTCHGRMIHYRCARGHGHAVTHAQFLAEKGLLRPLTEVDLAAPRNQLLAVSCVNCGAPLHALKDCNCPYCNTPVLVLDFRKALAALEMHDLAQRRREVAHAKAQDASLQSLLETLRKLNG